MKSYGGYSVQKSSQMPQRTDKTYGAGEYPTGSVPRETGFYSRECSNPVLPDHNKMTVCRVRRRG